MARLGNGSLRNVMTLLLVPAVFLGVLSCATPDSGGSGLPREEVPAPRDFVSTTREAEPPEAPVSREVTGEEAEFMESYLAGLCYMVYFDQEAADPGLAREGARWVGDYLRDSGYGCAEISLIENLKNDPSAMEIYAEETARRLGVIQWIARKLDADIYLELGITPQGRSGDSAGASFTLDAFDVVTGKKLSAAGGTAGRSSAPAGAVSLWAELETALAPAVEETLEAVREETRDELYRGLRYGLTVENLPSGRSLGDFEEGIKAGLRSFRRVSFSGGTAVYEVYMLGAPADLEDLVYRAAEIVPAMEGITLVLQQGNNLVFDLGL